MTLLKHTRRLHSRRLGRASTLLAAILAGVVLSGAEANAEYYNCYYLNDSCGFGGLAPFGQPGYYQASPTFVQLTAKPFMHNQNSGTSKRQDLYRGGALQTQKFSSAQIWVVPLSEWGYGSNSQYVCVNLTGGNVGVNCGKFTGP